MQDDNETRLTHKVHYAVYGKVFKDNEQAWTDWRFVEGTRQLLDVSNRESVEGTLHDVIYHPSDRRRKDRIFDKIPIFSEENRASFAAIQKGKNVFFFHIYTYTERNVPSQKEGEGATRSILPQVHIFVLSEKQLSQIHSENLMPVVTLTEYLMPSVDSTNVLSPDETKFEIPITRNTNTSRYALPQLELAFSHFFHKSSDHFVTPFTSTERSDSSDRMLQNIARVWLHLRNGKKVLLSSEQVTFVDALILYDAILYLFSVEKQIKSFASHNIADFPVDVLLGHPNEFELYTGSPRERVDLTEPFTEDEIGVYELLQCIFLNEKSENTYDRWKNVVDALDRGASIAEVAFQCTREKMSLSQIIEQLQTDRYSPDVYKNVYEEQSEEGKRELLEHGLLSENSLFRDEMWMQVFGFAEPNQDFIFLIEWYFFAISNISHQDLVEATKHFGKPDNKSLLDVLNSYTNEFIELIKQSLEANTPIVFKDGTRLLGIVVQSWQIGSKSSLFQVLDQELRKNARFAEVVIDIAKQSRYLQPWIIIEYAFLVQADWDIKKRIELRVFLIENGNNIIPDVDNVDLSIITKFIDLSESINRSDLQGKTNFRLTITWLSAFEKFLNNKKVRNALFFTELPLVLTSNKEVSERPDDLVDQASLIFNRLSKNYLALSSNSKSELDLVDLKDTIRKLVEAIGYGHNYFTYRLLRVYWEMITKDSEKLTELVSTFYEVVNVKHWRILLSEPLLSLPTSGNEYLILTLLSSESFNKDIGKFSAILTAIATDKNWDVNIFREKIDGDLLMLGKIKKSLGLNIWDDLNELRNTLVEATTVRTKLNDTVTKTIATDFVDDMVPFTQSLGIEPSNYYGETEDRDDLKAYPNVTASNYYSGTGDRNLNVGSKYPAAYPREQTTNYQEVFYQKWLWFLVLTFEVLILFLIYIGLMDWIIRLTF